MALAPVDWLVIGAYVVFAIWVGLRFTRTAGQDVDEFFLSGRRLPWWIAGTSMVATSFAADTPLVITGWVRDVGVAKNWLWWSFAISNALGVFVFARLWRRGEVVTKAELAELRYGERGGRALRTMLGVVHAGFTNTITLCWVLLAFAKIADVVLGIDKAFALVGASSVALAYSLLAGFWGVVVTDLVQFVMAMVGAVALAVFAWLAVGGIPQLIADGAVSPESVALFPAGGSGDSVFDAAFWTSGLAIVVINLGVGWWAQESVDGSSVTVQRVAASRDEDQGVLAVLWYSFVHYAIRPWPWIVVAIASLAVLPTREVRAPEAGVVHTISAEQVTIEGADGRHSTIALSDDGEDDWIPTAQNAGVEVGATVHAGDVIARTDSERAYVVMMVRYLPTGLLGLVVASLLAAFMSTIDTHVNLAAAFFTYDLYRARWAKGRSAKHYVSVARWASAAVMAVACGWAFWAESISGLFTFLLAFLGGVGPVYVLRWIWWRVEARMEITAMIVSALVTSFLAWAPLVWGDGVLAPRGELLHEARMLIVVACSTGAAFVALVLGPRADPKTRVDFYRRFRPPGWWGPVRAQCRAELPPASAWTRPLLGSVISVAALYATMLGIGWSLLGRAGLGVGCLVAAIPLCAATLVLARARPPHDALAPRRPESEDARDAIR
jgi:Na+/proline symporter